MLLPNKYIPVDDTLPAIGRELYGRLRFRQLPERLWASVQGTSKTIGTLERFIYGLDFLYALGLIEFSNGFIRRVEHADQSYQ